MPFEHAREEVLVMAVDLRDLLSRHLDIEDELIVPRLPDAFTEAELAELDERIKRSLPKKGLGFALPWNVAAMPAELRDEMMDDGAVDPPRPVPLPRPSLRAPRDRRRSPASKRRCSSTERGRLSAQVERASRPGG